MKKCAHSWDKNCWIYTIEFKFILLLQWRRKSIQYQKQAPLGYMSSFLDTQVNSTIATVDVKVVNNEKTHETQ